MRWSTTKISYLRALYPDPEIIIFDEAASALDNKSEELIIKMMLKLKDQGKTVIAITLRMGATKVEEKAILLDKRILEAQGSHSWMIEENDQYRNYWQAFVP